MLDVDMDEPEESIVGKILASLSVLVPPDVGKLVGLLRKAFVTQGLSRSSRARVLTAIEALSSFEVGLLTTEELSSYRDPKELHEPVSASYMYF